MSELQAENTYNLLSLIGKEMHEREKAYESGQPYNPEEEENSSPSLAYELKEDADENNPYEGSTLLTWHPSSKELKERLESNV